MSERFDDLATRWLAARMVYQRLRGAQPGAEPQAARLERIRAQAERRRFFRRNSSI